MMRRVSAIVVVLLGAELLDELVFGAREAAWPQISDDLDLSYTEVGVLLSVPFYASALLEPVFGVLGDSRWRRAVILGGGIAMAASLALVAGANTFVALLVAFAVLFPANGAFVSLSQATLMDREPERRDVNMTRWAVAGGVGAVAGPLLVLGAHAVGLDWRWVFGAFAVLALVLALVVGRVYRGARRDKGRPSFAAAFRAVRRPLVARWLALLEVADLMLDVLLGFLALYFANEVADDDAIGSLAIAVWTGAALVGGIALAALLERIDGLRYLRLSALAALLVYPAFLLVDGSAPKLALLALLGVVTAGWYSIPKARLYASLSGQSGAAVALGSVAGVVGGVVPFAIGALADRWSLGAALWLLLAAPVALLVAVPRQSA